MRVQTFAADGQPAVPYNGSNACLTTFSLCHRHLPMLASVMALIPTSFSIFDFLHGTLRRTTNMRSRIRWSSTFMVASGVPDTVWIMRGTYARP